MNRTMCALTAVSLALAGCAANSAPPEEMPAMPEGECKAQTAQDLVGQKATSTIGAELLRRTGARVLRWVPPNTAVTMDYRADRLTVGYDEAYIIGRISCG